MDRLAHFHDLVEGNVLGIEVDDRVVWLETSSKQRIGVADRRAQGPGVRFTFARISATA
jgi:hypothetical protein